MVLPFLASLSHCCSGPIVRIGPDQLHVSDPDFLLSLFSPSGKRRNKYEVGTRVFGSSEAGIATLDHEMHKMRRGAVGKYFSKEAIRRAEPIIHGALERLFARLDEYKRTGQPLTMSLVYMAFSSDIITEYCFAAPYNYLDHPNFNAQFFEMAVSVHGIAPLARRVPWLMPLMDSIPPFIVAKMDPGMALFIQFREIVLILYEIFPKLFD
jgi:cytochrome P450